MNRDEPFEHFKKVGMLLILNAFMKTNMVVPFTNLSQYEGLSCMSPDIHPPGDMLFARTRAAPPTVLAQVLFLHRPFHRVQVSFYRVHERLLIVACGFDCHITGQTVKCL